jgi:hypothetical protein
MSLCDYVGNRRIASEDGEGVVIVVDTCTAATAGYISADWRYVTHL